MFQRCSFTGRLRRLSALAFGAMALCQAAHGIGVLYTLTDIGSLGGTIMTPTAINNSGAVVGYGSIANGDHHAFVYSNGVLTDLGTFGQVQSWATGITDAGAILGQAGTSSILSTFTYASGTTTPLPASIREVEDINNAGTIVGVTSALGNDQAISYDGSTTTLLTPGFHTSRATAINEVGQIALTGLLTSGSSSQGYISTNGTLTNIGTLGGAGTSIYDLNNFGQAVGASQTSSGQWHGFLYDGGTMVDLGTYPGLSLAINNLGQAVGSNSAVTGGDGAFVYSDQFLAPLGPVTDYGATAFETLDYALAINDRGQIAGYGMVAGGATHAFLLTPLSLTPVPEPAIWGVIVAAPLVAMASWRLRRRKTAVRLPTVR